MQKSTILFISKIVISFLVAISLIASIVSSGYMFLYLGGFAGLMGIIIIPLAVILTIISVAIIIIANKQKNNIGIILLGIVILLNILSLLYSIAVIKEGQMEKNRSESYKISTENPTFDNCLSLPHPQSTGMCGNGMITKNNDLLSCLRLSKESYIKYPEYFEYPGFICSFDSYLGKFDYSSTLLDKPDKLAQVLEIFEKRSTDYYKVKDENILDSATSYQDCLLIMNSVNAGYCAQKILNITKDYKNCIKLSYDHGQKIAELKEIGPEYFECKLGGLSYSGSIYNKELDFADKIEAQIVINNQGLYLTEHDAQTDLAYRYCTPQQINRVNINSEIINSDIREAMETLNVGVLFQSCANPETFRNAHNIDEAYDDISEYDLYHTELQANKVAESNLRCDYKSHAVNITDSKLSEELTDRLLELKILQAFRPCTDEVEYLEFRELSKLDWNFNSHNKVSLISSENTILIDDFGIEPLVSPTFVALFSKDVNYKGYDYAVQVTFDNPDKIEIGQSSELNFESNKHPISLKKQREDSTGTINYCEINTAPESWFVNVIEFEKKPGGIFSIEFEVNADCDGESFKIAGQYKTRLPLEYKKLFLE